MSTLTVQKMVPATLSKVMVIKGDEKLTLYYILKSLAGWSSRVQFHEYLFHGLNVTDKQKPQKIK